MGVERPVTANQFMMIEDRLQRIQRRLETSREKLLCHPIYGAIDSLDNLHVFMQTHVFAVWDFMSLLKTLQQRLCGSNVPWIPPADPVAARLVNEIVLGEETDLDGNGSYVSHFGLYRRAMQRCHADATMIDAFTEAMSRGNSVEQSLGRCQAPTYVQDFVRHTFRVIDSGNLCEIAAVFTFSREDLLPSVFQQIVKTLNHEVRGELEAFRYYLDRHIEIDTDEHGPMAMQMLATLCGTDEQKWSLASDAAAAALEMRCHLWDGMHAEMRASLEPAAGA